MRYEITQTNVKSFEDWLQREERSQGTIEKYLRDLRAFCRFGAEQNATAEELKEKLASWKDYLIRSGYAVVTVNSMLTAVNGFFRFMGWEECRVRPVRRQRRIFSDEKKELSKSEYMCLLRAAEEEGNQRLYYILQTIAATGIRVSELPFITVESLKTGRSEVQCKGKLRVILLTRKLCKALQGYCRKKGIQSGPVFVTRSGKPMNRSNIWSEMKRLCEIAGVAAEKVFPHNLRHLFARTFYRMEKDIAKLADLLGHASIDTTRIYIMESGREHERQVERMGLVL